MSRSVVLAVMARVLTPLFLLFSLFLLVRGHDEPGGGFVAGVTAAAGLVLHGFVAEPAELRRALRIPPLGLVGAGLVVAAAAGLVGAMGGEPFLSAVWPAALELGGGRFKLGTPLLFDLGVYLAVSGGLLAVFLSLWER